MLRSIKELFGKIKKNISEAGQRNKYVFLANIIGILVNVTLCIIKLLIGIAAGSVAAVTDAFNNLSDAGSNVVTLLGVHLSQKSADKKHPLGHGRLEYLTALIVDIVIVVVGIELMRSSVDKILNPTPVEISSLFILLMVLAIAVKLFLFFFYRKMGSLTDSAVLRATALDSLTDILTTALVLSSSLISQYTAISLDGYAGILVSCFILFAGFKALKEPVDLLLGTAPNPNLLQELEQFVQQYPDILRLHDLIVHDYGPTRFIITFHAEISAEISLIQAHQIIDQIEKDMQERFHCQVTIHPDPVPAKGTSGQDTPL